MKHSGLSICFLLIISVFVIKLRFTAGAEEEENTEDAKNFSAAWDHFRNWATDAFQKVKGWISDVESSEDFNEVKEWISNVTLLTDETMTTRQPFNETILPNTVTIVNTSPMVAAATTKRLNLHAKEKDDKISTQLIRGESTTTGLMDTIETGSMTQLTSKALESDSTNISVDPLTTRQKLLNTIQTSAAVTEEQRRNATAASLAENSEPSALNIKTLFPYTPPADKKTMHKLLSTASEKSSTISNPGIQDGDNVGGFLVHHGAATHATEVLSLRKKWNETLNAATGHLEGALQQLHTLQELAAVA